MLERTRRFTDLVTISGDTPFEYRFRSTKAEDGTLKIYGPRSFAKVVEYYRANDECEARPAGHPDAAWHAVSAWADQLEPPQATERQLRRLKRLGIDGIPDLSEDQARRLIQQAEDELPPTKSLLDRAKTAGVVVSVGESRGSLKARLDAADRTQQIERLRTSGAEIDDGASWEDITHWEDRLEAAERVRRSGLTVDQRDSLAELEEAEFLMDDLRQAAASARPAGIRYRVQKGMSVREAKRDADALWVVADLYEELAHDCDGRGGSPKTSELKAGLDTLFKRLRAGLVSEDQAEEWIAARLGLRGGCLTGFAVLLSISGAVGWALGQLR